MINKYKIIDLKKESNLKYEFRHHHFGWTKFILQDGQILTLHVSSTYITSLLSKHMSQIKLSFDSSFFDRS